MAAILRTDHVNYLIWRYLQEYGYGRTAVQLTRDWGEADPQVMPFAHSVEPHALLSVLQDGLVYDELVSATEQSERRYEFLTERKRRVSGPPQADNISPENTPEVSRKRIRLDADSTSSRIQKEHGLVNGGPKEADSYDGQPLSIADVEPSVISQPKLESTLVIGHSIGIQSEKPSDLMTAKTIHTLPVPESTIIHLSWDTSDPQALVTAGDSICRQWLVPEVIGHDGMTAEVSFEDMLLRSKSYFITAIAKATDHSAMAMAVEEDGSARSPLCEVLMVRGGVASETACRVFDPVLVLRWHPSANMLLGISAIQGGGLITVWNSDDGKVLCTATSNKSILDATWAANKTLVVCGEQIVEIWQVQEDLAVVESLPTDTSWENVKYDKITDQAACSTTVDGQLGMLSVKEAAFNTIVAHEDQITNLEWQPVQSEIYDMTSPRILATSCVNGSIKLWNARDFSECIHSLTMGSGIPAMTIAFSPSGEYVAAAGDRKVVIWKAERGRRPVASWTSPDRLVNGFTRNAEDDDHKDEDETFTFNTLGWNCDGSKIAYGIENKISIIEIKR